MIATNFLPSMKSCFSCILTISMVTSFLKGKKTLSYMDKIKK
jgi:hypothetical protein